jgi:hypothetical protein
MKSGVDQKEKTRRQTDTSGENQRVNVWWIIPTCFVAKKHRTGTVQRSIIRGTVIVQIVPDHSCSLFNIKIIIQQTAGLEVASNVHIIVSTSSSQTIEKHYVSVQTHQRLQQSKKHRMTINNCYSRIVLKRNAL